MSVWSEWSPFDNRAHVKEKQKESLLERKSERKGGTFRWWSWGRSRTLESLAHFATLQSRTRLPAWGSRRCPSQQGADDLSQTTPAMETCTHVQSGDSYARTVMQDCRLCRDSRCRPSLLARRAIFLTSSLWAGQMRAQHTVTLERAPARGQKWSVATRRALITRPILKTH